MTKNHFVRFFHLPKTRQRVLKLRRYLLLPIPFIALWPIIVAFIIFIPIADRRAESKKAIKEMKGYIYSSNDKYLRAQGYTPGGESLSPFDTF